MYDDLLQELETEYEQIRAENEREEERRKERIRREFPEIHSLTERREKLIYGTLRDILKGNADTDGLTQRMESLSAEIRVKLKENGLPENYLEPVYRCALCKDTGYTGSPLREQCSCLKKACREKLRKRIGLAAGGNETFESFDLSLFPEGKLPERNYSQRDLMKRCREVCEEWADRYPDVDCRDIMLSGKSGLGKTFLLHAMAERLIRRDVNVLIISAYRMLEILRKVYFSNEEKAEELTEAEVLMIDDLGSEPLMQNVTVEQLFNLINERQNHNLSTVISSNMNIEGLQIRYNERITSRLSDPGRCMMLMLQGKDLRKISG